MDAQELETSIGGNYSLQAQTFLMPLARLYLNRIGFPFPDGVVPEIAAGLAAYGRTGELQKLQMYSEMMILPSSWPEAIQQRIKWEDYSEEIANNLSLKTRFLMTEKELEAKQEAAQKAQQQQLQQETAANAIPKMLQDTNTKQLEQE